MNFFGLVLGIGVFIIGAIAFTIYHALIYLGVVILGLIIICAEVVARQLAEVKEEATLEAEEKKEENDLSNPPFHL